eukprot:1200987-Rhodomonas_salina.1
MFCSYNSASAELEKVKDPQLKRKDLPSVFDDPKDKWRRVCVDMVTTPFDLFIALFIVLNVLTMAFESFHQAQWQSDFGVVANFFFTFIFGVECCFKIFAYHPRRYYISGWHKFDYFIVMVSYAGVCIDSMGASVNLDPTLLRVLRVFRIFRILRAFRIFKAAKGLQAIIATLGNSLSSLINLGSMLALVFFIFAVLGVTLFGELCAGGDEQREGLLAVRCLFTAEDDMIEFHANFKGIGIALLMLFRVATGDAWGALLDASQLEKGPRGVSVTEWARFVELLGTDPGWEREDKDSPVRVAATAVQHWYGIVKGRESDAGWPAIDDDAQSWIDMARIALPRCVEEEEIVQLEKLGLAECSVDGHTKACVSSCGSSVAANLYFTVFFCLSAFVLLQLVIAVLMEQLAAMDNNERDTETVAGTSITMPRFKILVRRWRWNLRRKTVSREEWPTWRPRRKPSMISLISGALSRTPSSANGDAKPKGTEPAGAPEQQSRPLEEESEARAEGRGQREGTWSEEEAQVEVKAGREKLRLSYHDPGTTIPSQHVEGNRNESDPARVEGKWGASKRRMENDDDGDEQDGDSEEASRLRPDRPDPLSPNPAASQPSPKPLQGSHHSLSPLQVPAPTRLPTSAAHARLETHPAHETRPMTSGISREEFFSRNSSV